MSTPRAAQDPILDPDRLIAVAASGLLDTPADPAFDDLTRMAALVVGAPFAFATVVDGVRSFWKSCFGIPPDAPHQNTVEESFCQYVVRSQRELIVNDAAVDVRTRENPSVASMGVRAWAGFPLLAPEGEVLGSFCIVDTEPRVWSAREIEVIRTLSAAAAREIALRAAVQNERDARDRAEALAQALQGSLLPPALPHVAGLDIAARHHPAGSGVELLGDFYDLFPSRGGGWNVIVGDVAGKGIEAAKVASLARHTVAALAMERSAPADVLGRLNDTLLARSPAPNVFLTAVYATLTLDGPDCVVRLASAGHPAPIVRRSDGTARPVDSTGPLVGVMSEFDIREAHLRLTPGDALIVCTDGIHEARRGSELFGEDRLVRLIAAAPETDDAMGLARRIEDTAIVFGGAVTRDDIAVLVVRVPPRTAPSGVPG